MTRKSTLGLNEPQRRGKMEDGKDAEGEELVEENQGRYAFERMGEVCIQVGDWWKPKLRLKGVYGKKIPACRIREEGVKRGGREPGRAANWGLTALFYTGEQVVACGGTGGEGGRKGSRKRNRDRDSIRYGTK